MSEKAVAIRGNVCSVGGRRAIRACTHKRARSAFAVKQTWRMLDIDRQRRE
jgi:hypothetical protein